jgi:hypothetical protein
MKLLGQPGGFIGDNVRLENDFLGVVVKVEIQAQAEASVEKATLVAGFEGEQLLVVQGAVAHYPGHELLEAVLSGPGDGAVVGEFHHQVGAGLDVRRLAEGPGHSQAQVLARRRPEDRRKPGTQECAGFRVEVESQASGHGDPIDGCELAVDECPRPYLHVVHARFVIVFAGDVRESISVQELIR